MALCTYHIAVYFCEYYSINKIGLFLWYVGIDCFLFNMVCYKSLLWSPRVVKEFAGGAYCIPF